MSSQPSCDCGLDPVPQLGPGLSKAVAARLKGARKQARLEPRYLFFVDEVFEACGKAALSAQDIADARGTPSASTVRRIQAAINALVAQGLLVEAGEGRYVVDNDELARLDRLQQIIGG